MSTDRISIGDVEQRLRALSGGAGEMLSTGRRGIVTGGVVAVVSLLAASFLLGRRRGRRRATVLEIHRS